MFLIELALKENDIISSPRAVREQVRKPCAFSADPRPSDSTVPDAIIVLGSEYPPQTTVFKCSSSFKQFAPSYGHVPIAIITSSPATSDRHRSDVQGARYIE